MTKHRADGWWGRLADRIGRRRARRIRSHNPGGIIDFPHASAWGDAYATRHGRELTDDEVRHLEEHDDH